MAGRVDMKSRDDLKKNRRARRDLRPFNSLILVRERLPVAVCAYCFMPDHVHAILFPQENTTISNVMMRFKVAASRRIVPRRGQAIW